MAKKRSAATIRIPATTANLGPGFDTLGIALRLYNRVRVAPADGGEVVLTSPIDPAGREGAMAMLRESAQAFFGAARVRPFGMEVQLAGDVPIARGLGSSVTARLGVIAALNEIEGGGLSREKILALVTGLEHHPDNAAPAVYGGFTAAGMVGEEVRCLRAAVSSRLRFVALIPRFEVSTEEARKRVPASFSKGDTVHNLNRAALISAAFVSGNYEALRGLFDDRVHQPYRQALIPALPEVIRAGERAGAIGGWLSGSGSTIICATVDDPARVGRAMKKKLRDSDVVVLGADNGGYAVVRRGR